MVLEGRMGVWRMDPSIYSFYMEWNGNARCIDQTQSLAKPATSPCLILLLPLCKRCVCTSPMLTDPNPISVPQYCYPIPLLHYYPVAPLPHCPVAWLPHPHAPNPSIPLVDLHLHPSSSSTTLVFFSFVQTPHQTYFSFPCFVFASSLLF